MAKTTDKEERVRTWFHPVRLKLVDLLRTRGPMTQTELARLIDAAPASARYHLMRLVKAGFVEQSGTRPGPKGITEKLFTNVRRETGEEELIMETQIGSAKDKQMRELNLDHVREVHRLGKRIIMREPDRYFSINTADIKAPPEKLRELRETLNRAMKDFIATLPQDSEGEPVTLCVNMFPRKA